MLLMLSKMMECFELVEFKRCCTHDNLRRALNDRELMQYFITTTEFMFPDDVIYEMSPSDIVRYMRLRSITVSVTSRGIRHFMHVVSTRSYLLRRLMHHPIPVRWWRYVIDEMHQVQITDDIWLAPGVLSFFNYVQETGHQLGMRLSLQFSNYFRRASTSQDLEMLCVNYHRPISYCVNNSNFICNLTTLKMLMKFNIELTDVIIDDLLLSRPNYHLLEFISGLRVTAAVMNNITDAKWYRDMFIHLRLAETTRLDITHLVCDENVDVIVDMLRSRPHKIIVPSHDEMKMKYMHIHPRTNHQVFMIRPDVLMSLSDNNFIKMVQHYHEVVEISYALSLDLHHYKLMSSVRGYMCVNGVAVPQTVFSMKHVDGEYYWTLPALKLSAVPTGYRVNVDRQVLDMFTDHLPRQVLEEVMLALSCSYVFPYMHDIADVIEYWSESADNIKDQVVENTSVLSKMLCGIRRLLVVSVECIS